MGLAVRSEGREQESAPLGMDRVLGMLHLPVHPGVTPLSHSPTVTPARLAHGR